MKQVQLGNIKYLFDFMTDTIDIQAAKKEFPSCDYIGTGSVIFINGKKHLLERPFRFFKTQSISIKNTVQQQNVINKINNIIQ